MTTQVNRHPRLPVAPLAPLVVAVAAGIVADRFGPAWPTASWGALAAAATAAAGLLWRRAAGNAALVIAFAALGGGWHHHRWSDLAPDDLARGASESPRPSWVRGVLEDVPTFRPADGADGRGRTRAVLRVTGVCSGRRWQDASGRVQVTIRGDRTDLRAGTPVTAVGELAAVAGPLNPGEPDPRDRLRARGIRLRLVIGEPSGIGRDPDAPAWPVLQALGAVRAWSHARLVAGLDRRVAPLAAALLLGRREGIESDVNDAFARTGTVHLLAISGLHLQALAVVLFVVCRVLGVGRKVSFAVVALATVGYALLVGLAPSVVRSAAMTVMVCLGGLRDRYARPADALSLAALMTLWLNPAYLFDVGCQLSFLGVAALVWGTAPALRLVRRPADPLEQLEDRLEPWWRAAPRWIGDVVVKSLVVSTIVWLVTLPLVALRFHLVPPVGILLNVPLIPLTSAALLASGLTLGLSAVRVTLGTPAAWACAHLLGWTEGIVRWGAAQPGGHAYVAGPPTGWVLSFYGLLGLAAWAERGGWPHRRRIRAALGIWSVLGLGLALKPARPGALEADVLAVGHGLAVVIQTADGRTLLYDCGRLGDPDVGRRVIAPALWARGVRHLDAVLLSHADADHYDGLPHLLERFSIGAVRVPPGFGGEANPGAALLIEAVRARGVPVRTIAAGDRLDLGTTAALSVLHPPEGWTPGASDNARSVVLDLAAGGRHLLLTGDLEGPGLAALRTRQSRRFDAVLAPHHGGRSSNPPALYDWADPALVIASQRPPAPGAGDALQPLAERGIVVLRTWRRGAIRLRWAETELEARGFLDEPPATDLPRGTLRASARVWPWVLGPPGSSRSVWTRGAVGVLGFALGLALCLVLAVIEWGAWALVLPRRPPMSMAPDEPPWEPIEARAADGVLLRGSWRPAVESRGRAVVLHHGFGEAGASMRGRAEALARLGWDVAVPDSRGFGRSDGDRSSFGGREADDLFAWVDALADRLGPDGLVVAWGRSMGSAVVLRAAAGDPRIRALILEAPYPDLVATVGAWLARLRLPRALAGPLVRRAGTLAGVSLARPRPIDLAPEVRVPALILHGTDDPIIPPAEVRRLAAAFPRPAAVVEVAGARHGDVFDVGGSELIDRIAAFLAEAGTNGTGRETGLRR